VQGTTPVTSREERKEKKDVREEEGKRRDERREAGPADERGSRA